jgi:hypothetical protein
VLPLGQRCPSMSCNRVRRELLAQFALGEELGSRSEPHLVHLQSCADCRREVGIDRELVKNLRRALRERVEGTAPSGASWELVRRRTVDLPERSWTTIVVRWGGMVSAAAAAGVMLFAVASAPEGRLLPGTQSDYIASAARRVVPPVDESNGRAVAIVDLTRQTFPPLPGWPMQTQISDKSAARDEPRITRHMR